MTTATAIAVAVVLAFGVMPAAHAAPKPAVPTAAELTGKGISKAIVIRQDDNPGLFQMLYDEVSWLPSEQPQTSAPNAAKLGPKYTVRLLVKDAPHQVYDLYPLAAGGPRAYRPAKQPSGKKTAGWFFGRLSMSESLRLSGAPLKAKPDVVHGGIGGGIGEDVAGKEYDPVQSMSDVFTEVRRLFLLNGAILVIILSGLAGMAFLIRRRI
ncbi:hypothetical protein OHA21_46905 [Actinoplanes sp. NBC_00393]|uniref:hypothetical protein n=1 Tax=Actinoplanes sp. NBC_00393 TaxID=2975953 RepID=UPI002E1D5CA5